MQKPLISASAEMGGFVLVEAPAPNPGEHKCSGTQPSGLRLHDAIAESINLVFPKVPTECRLSSNLLARKGKPKGNRKTAFEIQNILNIKSGVNKKKPLISSQGQMRDSITFFPAKAGKNQRSHQFLNWWQRYATGISH